MGKLIERIEVHNNDNTELHRPLHKKLPYLAAAKALFLVFLRICHYNYECYFYSIEKRIT